MKDIIVIGMNQSDSGASYFFELKKDLFLHFEPKEEGQFALGIKMLDESDDVSYDDVIFADVKSCKYDFARLCKDVAGLKGKYPDAASTMEMEKKDMEKISSLGKMCNRMINSPLQVYKA